MKKRPQSKNERSLKSVTKSIVSIMLALILILSSFILYAVPSSAAASPSKVINLVFDDSESMIVDFGTKSQQDKWCQAKYALEIFAAMLDKDDVLNIYYMSSYGRHAIGEKDNTLKWYVIDRIKDYSQTPSTIEAPLTVKGSEPSQTRVDKIHNKCTVAGSTPFYAIEKAYYDLEKTTGFDQKWFVVLTDGAFIDRVDVKVKKEIETNRDEVKDTFRKYNNNNDINVEYFGIGKDSLDLSQIGDNFRRAVNSSDVPVIMRKICQDVFNRPSMGSNFNASTKEINVEIPLSQIVIFAQGDDSKVDSVSGISDEPSVCSVKYSTKATESTRFPNYYKDGNYKVDKSLTGSVYIYEGNFAPGKYKVSTKAGNIEVYYLLGVIPKTVLVKEDTEEEYPIDDNLVEGTYRVKCILADEANNDYSSKLDEKVDYTVTIGDATYKNGDIVEIKAGDLKVSTKAVFDITGQDPVSSEQSGKVKAADLVVNFEKKEYEISFGKLGENDYKNNTPIVLKATRQGKNLSDKDWKNLKLTVETKSKKSNIDFDWELGKENSTYYIYPKWKDNNKKEAKYGKIKIIAKAQLQSDGKVLESNAGTKVNLSATLMEKIIRNLFWIIPLLILLTLFIFYKSLKAYPSIVRARVGRNVTKNIKLSGDSLTVIGSRTASGQPQVSFSTKKLNRRWTASSARGIVLTGISGGSDVTSVQVKGKTYNLNEGTGEWEPKFKETPIYSGARFNLSKPSAQIDFNCKLYTKKK